jgi:NADPH-dependent 2,4-dienoyl-CoA reductase/sulfur reductase-like enzyme
LKGTDVLVIGGSAAGITAAITAKRYFKGKNVTVVRKEEKVLVPCGIPYIFGTVGDPDKNLIPDSLLINNGIELVIDEVKGINRQSKVVSTVKSGDITYDKLVLATGSIPIVPPIKGADLEGVFVVKKDAAYLEDLKSALDKARNLVIVGGGFIGVEFADECRKGRALNITVVEILPHCLALSFDDEICAMAEDKLRSNGINIITEAKVEEFLGDGRVEQVRLSNGEVLSADVVIFGIGVVPNVELAQMAGLKVDSRFGIWVDDYMRTGDPDIFAVGDCAEKRSFFGHGPSLVKLASVAASEARVAGANLFGLRRTRGAAVGVFSTVVGDLALGSVGLTERAAKEAGIEVVTGIAKAPDRHPGSMPGTKELGVKMIFDKDTAVIIGGQVYGGTAVGELTNLLATAVQNKMRAYELETMQIGTHPALTASPIAYQVNNAAEDALLKLRS